MREDSHPPPFDRAGGSARQRLPRRDGRWSRRGRRHAHGLRRARPPRAARVLREAAPGGARHACAPRPLRRDRRARRGGSGACDRDRRRRCGDPARRRAQGGDPASHVREGVASRAHLPQSHRLGRRDARARRRSLHRARPRAGRVAPRQHLVSRRRTADGLPRRPGLRRKHAYLADGFFVEWLANIERLRESSRRTRHSTSVTAGRSRRRISTGIRNTWRPSSRPSAAPNGRNRTRPELRSWSG